jgi:hypothetical protein
MPAAHVLQRSLFGVHTVAQATSRTKVITALRSFLPVVPRRERVPS